MGWTPTVTCTSSCSGLADIQVELKEARLDHDLAELEVSRVKALLKLFELTANGGES